MRFIVEIPNNRMTNDIKESLRGQIPCTTKKRLNAISKGAYITDLELAKVFIGNPFNEIKSITKLEN